MFFVLLFLCLWNNIFAAINMTVSPLNYEIELEPWESITQTATLSNNENKDVHIITWKTDFKTNDTSWWASFVRYSELKHDDQESSQWIELSSTGFLLPANSKKTITFTMTAPLNATPWGHYSAVLFKNNSTNAPASTTSWTKIGIKVDYAILILLTVKWDLNTEIEVVTPIINNPYAISKWGFSKNKNVKYNLWGNKNNLSYLWENTQNSLPNAPWINNSSNNNTSNISEIQNLDQIDLIEPWKAVDTSNWIDDCLIDFTESNFDNKCIDSFFDDNNSPIIPSTSIWNQNNTTLPLTNIVKTPNSWNVVSTSLWEEKDFSIKFTIPIKNTWNTHIKPRWTITLTDEKWKVIKWVGKKLKLNKLWAVIWLSTVVDYLPINDEWGNVLALSQRNFDTLWKWFPYETYDDNGKLIMKNRTPSEYYSLQNVWQDRVLMPWERVAYKKNYKTLNADINVIYKWDNWEDIAYSSAQEIPIVYTEKYIGLNPYIIVFPLFFILLFFILWIIALWKRKKCINKDCKKKIKRYIKRCPHCDAKQKKK